MKGNGKVLVLGAGIVGAYCARELVRAGAEVEVLEAGEAAGVRGATAAGMGHIVVNDGDEAGMRLCILGRKIWREDSPVTTCADGFIESGTLWMAEDEDSFRQLGEASIRLQGAGINTEIVDGSQLLKLEPALAADLVGGMRVPDDGVLYAPIATAAVMEEAVEGGAKLTCGVRVMRVESKRVHLEDGLVKEADAIVIATGIDALDLCEETGVEVPLFPREGQLAITARGTGILSHHVVEAGYQKGAHGEVEEAVACAILPRSTGQLCIGSSRSSRRTGRVDRQLIDQIIQRGERFVPGLSGLPIVRTWCGVRAATGDSRPLIGPLPAVPAVWIAAGFEGLGITQAPAAAQLICSSILGQAAPIDPQPYDPARVVATS